MARWWYWSVVKYLPFRKQPRKITILIGTLSINGTFSIALSIYQKVSSTTLWAWNFSCISPGHPCLNPCGGTSGTPLVSLLTSWNKSWMVDPDGFISHSDPRNSKGHVHTANHRQIAASSSQGSLGWDWYLYVLMGWHPIKITSWNRTQVGKIIDTWCSVIFMDVWCS